MRQLADEGLWSAPVEPEAGGSGFVGSIGDDSIGDDSIGDDSMDEGSSSTTSESS